MTESTLQSNSDDLESSQIRARDVAQFIEKLAPLDTAVPGDVNGFLFGDNNSGVRGICVCWSPTVEVIEKANAADLNMIVCHEIPFFFHTESVWFSNRRTESKIPNVKRYRLLLQNDICVYRAHSNWDVVPKYGNCDAFGTALGFTKEASRGKLSRIYEIPPTKVHDLIDQVKDCLEMDRVRAVGDLEKIVNKVGTACGGLGQFFDSPEELADLGAQVAIMGEVTDYTLRHAVELDLPLIETTHVGSENFGLKNLTRLLRENFLGLPTTFIDSGIPWTWF